jgi:hypothetical protein
MSFRPHFKRITSKHHHLQCVRSKQVTKESATFRNLFVSSRRFRNSYKKLPKSLWNVPDWNARTLTQHPIVSQERAFWGTTFNDHVGYFQSLVVSECLQLQEFTFFSVILDMTSNKSFVEDSPNQFRTCPQPEHSDPFRLHSQFIRLVFWFFIIWIRIFCNLHLKNPLTSFHTSFSLYFASYRKHLERPFYQRRLQLVSWFDGRFDQIQIFAISLIPKSCLRMANKPSMVNWHVSVNFLRTVLQMPRKCSNTACSPAGMTFGIFDLKSFRKVHCRFLRNH